MKQLDLYILKELVKPFLAGIFAFIVIMLSNNLFVYSEMILKTGLPANLVLSMLLYSLPSIIVLTFPVGFMFATLLVLGRLSKDSELLALRACGISFSRAITPILLIATMVSYFSFVFNDNIVPYSNMQVFKQLF